MWERVRVGGGKRRGGREGERGREREREREGGGSLAKGGFGSE